MTRALIVDDHADNLYLLRALLRGHGYEVDEARNGAEALARARQVRPDVVISDLLMPVMDGYTLLRRWKADAQLASIPFIVYTATYTDPRDEKLALDMGADAFLVKPTEPGPLMDCIDKMIAARSDGQRAAPAAAASLNDHSLLEAYSQTLVRKLEKKNEDLRDANRALQEELAHRKEAESRLRASEAEFRLLADVMPQMVWVTDPDGKNVYSNRRWVDFTGLSVEESRGHGWIEAYHPDDQAPALQRWKQALARGEGYDIEGRLRRSDGAYRWILVRALPHRDDSGRIVNWMGTCTDIDDVKRSQRRIEEQAALLDHAHDAILVRDADHHVTFWNKSASMLYGWPAPEAIGQSVRDLLYADPGEFDAAHEALMRDGEWVGELTQVARDGQRLHIEARWTLVRDAEGAPASVLCINTDIRQRRQSEAALKLRDRAIQEVSQGILITDASQPDHPIIYASAGFSRMTGYETGDVLGRNCRLLQGKDTDPAVVQALRDAIAQGRPCAVEILNYRKDGTPFWNALSISPVLDDKGQLQHFVGLQQDITERRRLETQLLQSQKMEAIGRLAGGIAHDFNNLLTIVSGHTERLLASPDLPDAVRDAAKAIGSAGDRAAAMTAKLLGFSRQSMMQPRVIDLNAVVTAAEDLIRPLLGSRIDYSATLAPVLDLVHVDPMQIDQVLMNLVINARDAMPDGGKLTLETTNVMLDEGYAGTHIDCNPGPHVMLAISDTGSGIPATVLPHIFEPFFTTKEVGKGTGLGLATVYGIVQQSGGCIHVYSEPGHGSVFKIYLPAATRPTDRLRGEAEGPSTLAGKETILLVEDDPGVRTLAATALEQLGYTVVAAADGSEALHLAATLQAPIDLVLTDLTMPNLRGPELVQRLREHFPHIRVLYMSGYTDDAVVRHGMLEATVSFIQKPYTPQALARRVREVLDAAWTP